MKSTSPAFSFYPKDWLSDANVKAMTPAAKGVYIDLLSICWIECGLPANTDRLARLVGMHPSNFKRLWPMIEPCFAPAENGSALLIHRRLERERLSQIERARHQSLRGRKGGRPSVPKADRPSQIEMAQRNGPSQPKGLRRSQPKGVSPLESTTEKTRGFSPAFPDETRTKPEKSLASPSPSPFTEYSSRQVGERSIGNGPPTHLPPADKTETAIRKTVEGMRSKLYGLIDEMRQLDPKARDPTELMRLVTGYQKADGTMVRGVVNAGLLTFERLEKSIEDAEANISDWKAAKK